MDRCKKNLENFSVAKVGEHYKVRYYCRYTGEYRGVYAEHTICNLKYSIPEEIIIIFHNGSNYDDHLVIKELAEDFEG